MYLVLFVTYFLNGSYCCYCCAQSFYHCSALVGTRLDLKCSEECMFFFFVNNFSGRRTSGPIVKYYTSQLQKSSEWCSLFEPILKFLINFWVIIKKTTKTSKSFRMTEIFTHCDVRRGKILCKLYKISVISLFVTLVSYLVI